MESEVKVNTFYSREETFDIKSIKIPSIFMSRAHWYLQPTAQKGPIRLAACPATQDWTEFRCLGSSLQLDLLGVLYVAQPESIFSSYFGFTVRYLHYSAVLSNTSPSNLFMYQTVTVPKDASLGREVLHQRKTASLGSYL